MTPLCSKKQVNYKYIRELPENPLRRKLLRRIVHQIRFIKIVKQVAPDDKATMVNKDVADLTDSAERRHWYFWFILAAGLFFISFGIFATLMIFKYHGMERYGYTTRPMAPGVEITEVDPEGPAAGKLEPGDRILAINGDARYSKITQLFWRGSALTSDQLNIGYERNGARSETIITNSSYQASQSRKVFRIRRNIAYWPRYLACLIVALIIGLLKPEDHRARLGSIAFLAISHQAVSYTIIPIRPLFTPTEDLIAYFFVFLQGAIWFGPAAYHVSYRFLRRIPTSWFWTSIKWLLYAYGSLSFLHRVILTTITQTRSVIELRSSYYKVELTFGLIDNWFWMVCMVAISAVLIRNTRLVRDPDQRRRFRILLYGSLIGVLPQTVIGLLLRIPVLITGRDVVTGNDIFETVRMLANISMIVVPLSWGYAIHNRQVYDINVVVRRSVQYLLAQNALRLFVALPIFWLSYIVITKSDQSLQELIGYVIYDQPYYLLLLLIAALGLIYRGRLQDWIDRQFFREAYQQDKILRELIDQVRRIDSMSEMSRIVSQKIDEALHPEQVYLFYRAEETRDLSLGYSSRGRREMLHIPEEYELLNLAEHHGKAIDYPLPQKFKLPQSEKDWLDSMAIRLIVPMNGTDHRLAGLLLLGPKKSGEPYNGSDRQLLDTLADQIAIVYENVRLKERVARERKIQHEVLARVDERHMNLLKECPKCQNCYDSIESVCPLDQSELRLSLPVERTIDGRYRLDKLLGRGGMGAVYKAEDLRLNRGVAVKILSGGYFGNAEALRRFEREAQASARLNHNNIVRVHDFGLLHTDGAYIVMELLKGRTLGYVLEKRGYIEPELAADWFDQVFSAVAAAHAEGVVHRDLKPDNIFISKITADDSSAEPQHHVVKILDFGVAKIMQQDVSAATSALTTTTPGTVIGTFGYMPPEQWTGEPVDERSDIFSLGVIIVRSLTGRKPFEGKNYQELMTAVMTQPFHIESDDPAVRRLDQAIQKCLAKRKEDRYPSVPAMQRELIPLISACNSIETFIANRQDSDTVATQKYDEESRK